MNQVKDKDSPRSPIILEVERLMEAGNYKSAIDEILSSDGDIDSDVEKQNLLSKCFIFLKDLSNAKQHNQNAKSLEKDNINAAWNEVRLLLAEGNGSDAVVLGKKHIKRDEANVEGLVILGSSLRVIGDFNESLAYLDKALQINPKYAEALVQKGVIALSSQDKKLALDLFSEAFFIKPAIKQIWDPLLSLLTERENFKNAIEVLLKILDVDHNDENRLNQLIAFNQKLGDPNLAIKSYSRACEIWPANFLLRLNLGLACKQSDKLEEAADNFRSALNVDHGHHQLHNELGVVYLRMQKVDEAIRCFEQAIGIKNDYAEAYNNKGNAFSKVGKIADAIDAYNSAIRFKPDYAIAYNNLGIAHSERNFSKTDIPASITAYRKAIEISPDNAAFYNNLGLAYKEIMDWHEAEKSYLKAIEINPQLPEAYNNLGVALRQQERLAEAIEAFDHALQISPTFVNAAYNLAAATYEAGNFERSVSGLKVVTENFEDSWDYPHKAFAYNLLTQRFEKYGTYTFSSHFCDERKDDFPLVFDHLVDPTFVEALKSLDSRELHQTTDTRHGTGRCSVDWQLFEDKDPRVQTAAHKLLREIEERLEADVIFHESFFNIFGAGGGTKPHSHLTHQDDDFEMGRQKYSLVYYLDVGDQSGKEPGTLKLYDPYVEVLPYNGMVLIMPASRLHNAIYDGKTMRIMVGANFYIS